LALEKGVFIQSKGAKNAEKINRRSLPHYRPALSERRGYSCSLDPTMPKKGDVALRY
jgi:hypothetical protein